MKKLSIVAIFCLLLSNVPAIPASAAPSASPSASAGAQASDKGTGSGFSGPSSVTGTMQKDSDARAAVPTRVLPTETYFNFKQRMEEDYGFGFGFDYNALYQAATNSPGEDNAAGGVFRAYGHWTPINRGKDTAGMIVYKVENRQRLGTDIAPKDLGFEAGYAGLTAVTFSDAGWMLTNLYWDQRFMKNRLGFVAGMVDITDYTDVYGLINIWTDFNNYAFATNPTIPAPDQGLGAAVRFMASDNLYLLGGIADANGHPTDPGEVFDSFFSDREYFTHLEVGWISSWAKRYNDNIHLTFWHADEREQAGVNDGWGAAFSFSRILADTWEPFFRAGYADDGGALWENSISAGVGYHPSRKSDVFSVGLNWSRPSEDTLGADLDDQYTTEIYYRWQALKMFSITPGVQLLFNPALNPDEDLVTVWTVRGRISF